MHKRTQFVLLFIFAFLILIGLTAFIISETPNPDKNFYDGPVMQAEGSTEMPQSSAFLSSTMYQNAELNINQATAEQLMTLEGIGEVLAGRIIAYRKENHGFQKIEELLEIEGIGTEKFNKIKEYIVID